MSKSKKESLKKEYERLKKEVAELNADLNDEQKEISPDNPPTADFEAAKALINHKIERMKEIEAQLAPLIKVFKES